MASPDEERTPRTIAHPTGLGAGDAALTFVLAIATFLLIGILIGGSLAGLATAEIVALVGVPVLVVVTRGLPLASLGLVRPPAGAVIGAALIGVSIWYVNLWIAAQVARGVDDDGEAGRHLAAMVDATPLAAILVLSLVPAIAEELACRGLLALGLRRRLGAAAAIAISAAAFAALHPSIVRLVPMFVLGALLGTLAVRTGSVVPSMIAHALNNAIALLIAAGWLDGLVVAVVDHPDLTFVTCITCTVGGMGIAWRSARPPW